MTNILPFKKPVHMTQAELAIAVEVTGWKSSSVASYDIDFLDKIMMQRTEEDKIFLSFYTIEEFQNLVPIELWLDKQTKTTIPEALDMVKHHIETGVWKYNDVVKTNKEVIWEGK